MSVSAAPKIGLALGSGAARGLAHIGVIRGLLAAGIEPEIVCGTSSGAVVGAAYASGRLDEFESWMRTLGKRHVAAYFDLSLRGGLIKARRMFEDMEAAVPDVALDALDPKFGAVATDLTTGQEVWLRAGGLYDALRATVALPGLITPAQVGGRWLVDGGLVNPVPVSLCRAMGADFVIAVDLNATLVGRRAFGDPGAGVPGPGGEMDQPVVPGARGGCTTRVCHRVAAAGHGRRAQRRGRSTFDLRSDREQHQHHAGSNLAQPDGGRAAGPTRLTAFGGLWSAGFRSRARGDRRGPSCRDTGLGILRARKIMGAEMVAGKERCK